MAKVQVQNGEVTLQMNKFEALYVNTLLGHVRRKGIEPFIADVYEKLDDAVLDISTSEERILVNSAIECECRQVKFIPELGGQDGNSCS